MEYQAIHETIVRDIVDVVADAKDADVLGGAFDKRSFRSAASATSALTLVFPCLTSSIISIEAAAIVTKAIERKAATMMQMLFSALCIDNAKDAIDYVTKYHTNLDTSKGMSVDSLIGALDKYVVSREGAMTAKQIENYNAIKEDLKNLDMHLANDTAVSEVSLNDLKFSNIHGNCNVINEAIFSSTKDRSDHTNASKNAAEFFGKQILPTDVKKANELVPTLLTINFVSTAKDGEAIAVNDVIIGVKAKLYPLDSMDIVNRVRLKNQDNNGFLKLVRASTREISFWKDFVFAIDKAKLDALSQSKRGSSNKLWKVLERRSLKSKLRRSFGMTNDATAISTLVISSEEVEYLKKEFNINIEDPKVMRPIMEAYNLMGVVLVDEGQEIARFMFDSGDDMYESISFTNLEREASDNSSKKIINLMTKMR